MNNIKIGNFTLNSKVSLAPMAGITDYVLRSLVRKYSDKCLLTTEMISSEALIQARKHWKDTILENTELAKRAENHSPISYQICGHKPGMMAEAAKILEPLADIIDINMGCPVNKVVKGQDGSALMRTPELAADIVKAVKDSVDLPVSVKFRLGYSMEEINFVEFGQAMQEAGAEFITIHGRTRSQLYSGKANWPLIKQLTENIDVPVFANGDVRSVEDAILCIEQSGANGVAVGRGALGDVSLIHRIDHYFNTGEIINKPSFRENVKNLKMHLNEEIILRGEDIGLKFMRKFYPYYLSGFQNAAKYRTELVLETDYDAIIKKLDSMCINIENIDQNQHLQSCIEA